MHAPVYPVRIDGALDRHLSRWLWLVKWWLLAIPHYLVVGLFVGGTIWVWHAGAGLIGILMLVAAVVVAFTAREG